MSWESFLPPLVGSFLGVIGAYISNYALQSHFAHNDKIKYINMIRSEIELCISRLEHDRIELLPIDRWASAINSGALKLFETGSELQSLSAAYQKINDYNHLATAEHFFVLDWARLEREDGVRLPLMTVRRFLANRQTLISELRELSSSDWLNPRDEAFPGYNDPLYEEIAQEMRRN
jgi:hypothetical protein